MKEGISGSSNVSGATSTTGTHKFKTKAEYEAKKASIFGDSNIREFKREVDGEKREILVGTRDGHKVRVDAETLEELVAVETSGKNEYITKSEFDELVRNTLGVSKLPEGMSAEFRHGSLVFLRGGEIMTSKELSEDAGLIAQRKADEANQQKLDLAKLSVPITHETETLAAPDVQIAQVPITKPKPQGARTEAPSVVTVSKQLDEVTVTKTRTADSQPAVIYKGSEEAKDLKEINGQFYRPGAKRPKPQGDNTPAAKQKDAFYEWNPKLGAYVKKGASQEEINKAVEEHKAQQAKQKAANAAKAKNQKLEKARTDAVNIAKAFNRTNKKYDFDPSARAIKDLDKDNVMEFMRTYQKNAVGNAHNIISTLIARGQAVGSKELASEAALNLLKAISQTPYGKNLKYNDNITLQSVIANIEKNGFTSGNIQNADEVLKKLNLSVPKPQGAKTEPAKPAAKPTPDGEVVEGTETQWGSGVKKPKVDNAAMEKARKANLRKQAIDNGTKMGQAARNGYQIDKKTMHEHIRNINNISEGNVIAFIKAYDKGNGGTIIDIIKQLARYNTPASKNAALKLLRGASKECNNDPVIASVANSIENGPLNWTEYAKTADRILYHTLNGKH